MLKVHGSVKIQVDLHNARVELFSKKNLTYICSVDADMVSASDENSDFCNLEGNS